MASKRRLRKRSCGEKIAYTQKEQAIIQAKIMQRYSRLYQAYKCRFCGKWHVGRRRYK